jgi:hypothetical protein
MGRWPSGLWRVTQAICLAGLNQPVFIWEKSRVGSNPTLLNKVYFFALLIDCHFYD